MHGIGEGRHHQLLIQTYHYFKCAQRNTFVHLSKIIVNMDFINIRQLIYRERKSLDEFDILVRAEEITGLTLEIKNEDLPSGV